MSTMDSKIRVTKSQLRSIIRESIIRNLNEEYNETINEKFNLVNTGKKIAAGGAIMGSLLGTPSCKDNSFYNEPTQTEVSYQDQQYAKFDWSLITDESTQGFVYDMYTGCANSGSRPIACIIQKDKYCWRYYVPEELKDEIMEKYRNKEVVDISLLQPFNGWRGY